MLDMYFVVTHNGYWGRDHGNDNGIPPDGFLRTLAGVYPAGGLLDDWNVLFNGPQPQDGAGNGGNGITPIILASGSDFMIAEAEFVCRWRYNSLWKRNVIRNC